MNLKEKQSKKIIILVSLIILLIILICFISTNIIIEKKNNYQKEINTDKIFLEYNEFIEYGTTWKYTDFISKVVNLNEINENTDVALFLNNELLSDDYEYTFNQLKEHNLLVELNYKNSLDNKKINEIKTTKSYTLKVVDTIPPIINGVSDKIINSNDQIDLKSGINAIDNVDGEIEVLITSDANFNEVGDYKIEVSAIDSSGNKTTSYFTVTVKPQVTTTTRITTKPKTTASTTTKATTTKPSDESTKAGRLNLAKSEAKSVVSKIIKPGMSDEEKAYAIFVYLMQNVALQTNQSSEAYKINFGNEAYAALVLKIAACSGFCKAVTLLCNEAGLQSQHVNANLWTHQWNKVLINGEWIVLDAQGGIFGGTTHPLE